MRLRNESGMALLAVLIMLVVMTTIGTGMYRLVSTTIGVSGGYLRKATTRSVAVAQGALLMQTLASSVTAGTVVLEPGLTLSDPNALRDLMALDGNDIHTDDPESSPDFTFVLNGITARADVDFVQSIPMAGGSIEFASAYDGVGNGQSLGTSFLIEQSVHIIATDTNGSRSEVRFFADH